MEKARKMVTKMNTLVYLQPVRGVFKHMGLFSSSVTENSSVI